MLVALMSRKALPNSNFAKVKLYPKTWFFHTANSNKKKKKQSKYLSAYSRNTF